MQRWFNFNKFRFSSSKASSGSSLFEQCESALIDVDAKSSAEAIIKINSDLKNLSRSLLKEQLSKECLASGYKGQTYSLAAGTSAKSVREINEILTEKHISKNIQLLHALAHIEYNAMKSYLDTSLRFLREPTMEENQDEFFLEFLGVAAEESEHFLLLLNRLQIDGFTYGSLPVHASLIDNVKNSLECSLTRIALISIISEGKGVDSGDRLLKRLISFKDVIGIEILKRILREEVGHIGVGNKWFQILCKNKQKDPVETFLDICKTHQVQFFKPYNRNARVQAGYDQNFIQAVWGNET